MMNKSLKVLGFQLQVELDCDEINEFLILNKSLNNQMEDVKSIISSRDADIIIFPEMCYIADLEDYYKEISNKRIVIAGSVYIDGFNYTIIFQNGEKKVVRKYNASGAEPMVRYQEHVDTNTFLKKYLKEHIFKIKGKKIVVLNCMEYYQHAYRIARECSDIFAIICICSNSNQKVFLEETKALSNHVENIYSFVVNCVSNYTGKKYAKGNSYIFGPVQRHERDWLLKEGKYIEEHNCSIVSLSSSSEYFYGEFDNSFSRFGRSDFYKNNPKNLEVGKIRGGDVNA